MAVIAPPAPPHAGPDSDAHLAVRQMEIAATYLRTNFAAMPFVTACLGLLLTTWAPVAEVTAWAAAAVLTQVATYAVLARFLADPRRASRARIWSLRLGAMCALFATVFGAAPVLFYAPGVALNNTLAFVVLTAGLAGAAAQTGPSPAMALGNMAPYAAFLLWITLAHEPFPTNAGLTLLALGYVAICGNYARNVHQLARGLLVARTENDALIGELRRATAESDAARARAEAANAAKSDFLANMSHELRTPLNAILGFSEALELGYARTAEKTASYARNIQQSGQHLLALINDILDLAKIEAGRLTLSEERLSLAAAIDEAMRFVDVRASRSGLRLHADVAGAPDALADARALRQVMANLLSNAVKFTPAGGTVTAFAHRRPDGGAAFGVRDSGVGIAPEDQARVFEAFGQGRHDITTPDKGTGLGLSIVKGLVEAHGGSVALESAPGRGTTVTCTLPPARVFDASQDPDGRRLSSARRNA